MGFQENFTKALQSNQSLLKTDPIHKFLFFPSPAPDVIEDNIPVIQAYGIVKAFFPYYCELSGLCSYCLLYTDSGAGILTAEDSSYTLNPGTLAFLDCRECHRIDIRQSPWYCKVFFMTGKPLSFLHLNYSSKERKVHTFPAGSQVPDTLGKFYGSLSQNSENFLLHARFILDIIIGIILEEEKAGGQNHLLPDYIAEIKQNFDKNYGDKFTLESLEQKYQISKYRICREFSSHYGSSPIRYLNNIRIAAAREELVHSDKRINEIGRMVSFENTNHFIRLFKQNTGVTPSAYRKTAGKNII